LVFRHIETDWLGPGKKLRREYVREFRFADSRRSDKKKGSLWPAWVRETQLPANENKAHPIDDVILTLDLVTQARR
jgi:hypothetical protein